MDGHATVLVFPVSFVCPVVTKSLKQTERFVLVRRLAHSDAASIDFKGPEPLHGHHRVVERDRALCAAGRGTYMVVFVGAV